MIFEIGAFAWTMLSTRLNQTVVSSGDIAADGHAIVLGSLQLRDQPCVPGVIVREHEDGRLEPERTEVLLDGGRDLRMFAEPEDAPTRGTRRRSD